jgi:hypothetical protein
MIARRGAALLGALVLAACSLLTEPQWVRDRTPLAPCGDVTVVRDEPLPAEATQCMTDALRDGTGGELVIRSRDPVQGRATDAYQRVLPDGSAELILHLDPERSGASGWELHRCRGAQISDVMPGSIQLNDCEQIDTP